MKNLTTNIWRFIWIAFAWVFVCVSFLNISNAQTNDNPFPYDINSVNQLKWDSETTDIAGLMKQDSITPNNSIMTKLRAFFRLSGTTYDKGWTKATDYIKWILNILLGLISFIALILVIYAFYLIFFSKWEEWVTKAKKILVGVAIALALMWLSRFIVSFFFNIFRKVT